MIFLLLFLLLSLILSFADDTKCFGSIADTSDVACFQSEIDNWSIKWRLRFNTSKFALVHFSKRRFGIESCYTAREENIPVRECHKDLGIMISSDLSWTEHYHLISGKAYAKLGMIRRCFSNPIPMCVKLKLYTALVRSQLVYGSQLWRPFLLKDIKSLERIQRRATKYILNEFTLNYRERLIALKLLPLMRIFELNDIMFFIANFKEKTAAFSISDHVCFSNRTSRSGPQLVHTRSTCNKTRHFFFNRIPRLWNSLSPLDLSLGVSTLKRQLKSKLWSHFIRHFNPSDPCSIHFLCPCNKCLHSHVHS